MEQFNLSKYIKILMLAYPKYFKDLSREESIEISQLYYSQLKKYSVNVVEKAINDIIQECVFMPTISEIIKKCNEVNSNQKQWIIEKMIEDGYFYSQREIEKAYHFIEEGIIPKWFQTDMQKYSNIKLLGD